MVIAEIHRGEGGAQRHHAQNDSRATRIPQPTERPRCRSAHVRRWKARARHGAARSLDELLERAEHIAGVAAIAAGQGRDALWILDGKHIEQRVRDHVCDQRDGGHRPQCFIPARGPERNHHHERDHVIRQVEKAHHLVERRGIELVYPGRGRNAKDRQVGIDHVSRGPVVAKQHELKVVDLEKAIEDHHRRVDRAQRKERARLRAALIAANDLECADHEHGVRNKVRERVIRSGVKQRDEKSDERHVADGAHIHHAKSRVRVAMRQPPALAHQAASARSGVAVAVAWAATASGAPICRSGSSMIERTLRSDMAA